MEYLNLGSLIIGGMIVVLGLVSKRLERSPLPPTLLALLLGIALGPQGIELVDLSDLGDRGRIMEGAARLTLAIGLMGVALRIPCSFPRAQWRPLAVLVGMGMLLMWGISTGLVYFLLGLPFWLAALIAAIVTPTDPVAASPIVTGSLAERCVPERVRNAISFESGANDGLAYLFVFLAYLMLRFLPGEALGRWFVEVLLYQVLFATVVGAVLGVASGKLLVWAERHDAIASHWRLVYTVAVALLAAGLGRIISSDELMVLFATGIGFAQVVSASDRENEEKGQEAVNRFFAIPMFLLIGAAIPWAGWWDLGWSGIALAAALLLLRRPPVLLFLRSAVSPVRSVADALFMGWFGPIAVAAVYYASLMEHRLHEPLVWHAVSLVVVASTVAHGVTGAPLTRAYARHNPDTGRGRPPPSAR